MPIKLTPELLKELKIEEELTERERLDLEYKRMRNDRERARLEKERQQKPRKPDDFDRRGGGLGLAAALMFFAILADVILAVFLCLKA